MGNLFKKPKKFGLHEGNGFVKDSKGGLLPTAVPKGRRTIKINRTVKRIKARSFF